MGTLHGIKLTKGEIAFIDEEDYPLVSQYSWYFHSAGYAAHFNSKTKETILMHRLIMNPPKELDVDHIDSNRLNNQKLNLRICTTSQNMAYKKLEKTNKSGYKGVSWSKLSNKWRACIHVNNKFKHLGLFKDKDLAAQAYNAAAQKYFGEFGRLNYV